MYALATTPEDFFPRLARGHGSRRGLNWKGQVDKRKHKQCCAAQCRASGEKHFAGQVSNLKAHMQGER